MHLSDVLAPHLGLVKDKMAMVMKVDLHEDQERLRHRFFFLLLAAKVRSSCEEGPGQSALQSAYHDPQLDVTELKQHRTT